MLDGAANTVPAQHLRNLQRELVGLGTIVAYATTVPIRVITVEVSCWVISIFL